MVDPHSGRRLSLLIHSRVFYPSIGGLERVSEHLARALTELGAEVTVLTDTPLAGARELGPFRIVRGANRAAVDALVSRAAVVHVSGFSVRLARPCHRARRPLIWTHHGYQAVCPEGNLLHGSARCHGRPVRCVCLSIRHRGWPWSVRHYAEILLRRALLRTAAANVSVSAWVASRIRAPRSHVIWNPIDLHGLAPGEKVRNRGEFSFFGRLVQEKGVDILLEALARCRNLGHPFSARIVGDGPERVALEKSAGRLGVAAVVKFDGTLTGDSLCRAQADAWVAVVPSSCEEAFGVAAGEAMATGTPLIVSRDGGVREVALGCALDFTNGDVEGLAGQMINMYAHPELWRDLSAAGPERARLFDPRAIATEYTRLYTSVCL